MIVLGPITNGAAAWPGIGGKPPFSTGTGMAHLWVFSSRSLDFLKYW